MLVYALGGESAERALERLFGWLKQHAATIAIGVLVIFGLYFLVKGTLALAA